MNTPQEIPKFFRICPCCGIFLADDAKLFAEGPRKACSQECLNMLTALDKSADQTLKKVYRTTKSTIVFLYISSVLFIIAGLGFLIFDKGMFSLFLFLIFMGTGFAASAYIMHKMTKDR